MYISKTCIVHPHTYRNADQKNSCVIVNENPETERKIKLLEQSRLWCVLADFQMAVKLLAVDSYHWKDFIEKQEITTQNIFFLMFTHLVQASSEKYVFQQQDFWPQKWNLFVRSNRRGMLVILGFCSACLDFPSWFCCQSKAVCRALAKGSFRNSD